MASAHAIWPMVQLNRSWGSRRGEDIDENLKRAMARMARSRQHCVRGRSRFSTAQYIWHPPMPLGPSASRASRMLAA
jgi:hypothetical protein